MKHLLRALAVVLGLSFVAPAWAAEPPVKTTPLSAPIWRECGAAVDLVSEIAAMTELAMNAGDHALVDRLNKLRVYAVAKLRVAMRDRCDSLRPVE